MSGLFVDPKTGEKYDYEGVDPEQNTGPGTGDNGEVVTYGLEASLTTEPIESHPDFAALLP